MTSAPVLQIDALRVDLGAAGACRLTATLPPGACVRLDGPSGAGKTTLMRAVARLQAPTEGRVRLDGRGMDDVPAVQWRRSVGYVPQYPSVFPGTVEDNLRAPVRLAVARGAAYDAAAARAYVEAVGLPVDVFGQDARTLSGGEAARVALVRALLARPRVVLLDEVTAPLDADTAERVTALVEEYVRRGSHAALVVAHAAGVWDAVVSDIAHVERAS